MLHQAAVALRLLQRGQVLPLQVFNQRQLPHLLVVGLYHNSRNLTEPGQPAGAPAPLAGNDLVHPAGQAAHHHRLQHAVLPDGIRQLGQRLGLEGLAGLLLVRLDIRDPQRHQAAAVGRLVIQKKRVQPFSQSAFLCHRSFPSSLASFRRVLHI